MTEGVPLLELRGVSKVFGAVRALSNVNLTVEAGKVTALVGDNGAGKSTAIKTISGLWEPTEGEILWEGKPVHPHSPNDAEALGITTIYQDLALCDNLDIVQNMFLGHEKLRYGLLDETSMEIAARQTLADLHVTTVRSIRQPVASLSGGQRQSVAVAKAVMSEAKLVIMDEPTAALGVAQTHEVLELIKRLSSQGTAVLAHFAQPQRRLRSGRRDRRALPRAVGRRRARRDFDRQVVVEYMTTGESSRTGAAATGDRTMTDTIDEPAAPSESRGDPSAAEAGTPTAPSIRDALVVLAPDVLADSLGDYLRAWWRRIRGGESGALPIIAGLIVIFIFFDIQSSAFLTATNIVNLFIQAAFIILLGMAELYALILSEIDLSVAFVGAVGTAIALALMGAPQNWPWWAAIIVGPGRLRRHRLLPGDDHHPAQDPVLRRDAGRPLGLAGRPHLRLRRRQGRRRRSDHDLQLRRRRPRQRQHDAGRRLDPARRRRRPLRPDLGLPYGAAPVPGAQRAATEHHDPHHCRRGHRRRPSWSTSAT